MSRPRRGDDLTDQPPLKPSDTLAQPLSLFPGDGPPARALAPASRSIHRPIYASQGVELYEVDCFDWLRERAPHSVHAVVTDPPYGLIEYQESHLEKMKNGQGGVWRIPPTLDGYTRSPLPRFTVHTRAELALMTKFFGEWARLIYRVLVPGGHVFVATNPLLSDLVYAAIRAAGFEKRGELIRLVTTLRGGDRPKGAEDEFPDVTVMPRSYFEPWGIFRKPFPGTVANNLRRWKTGGLRRVGQTQPFGDVFRCPPAGPEERRLAGRFPTLKPQKLMRYLVRASLPLGEGIVLDPFAGSGSTLAAAQAIGYRAIGLEKIPEYARLAAQAIPALAGLPDQDSITRGRSSSPEA